MIDRLDTRVKLLVNRLNAVKNKPKSYAIDLLNRKKRNNQLVKDIIRMVKESENWQESMRKLYNNPELIRQK